MTSFNKTIIKYSVPQTSLFVKNSVFNKHCAMLAKKNLTNSSPSELFTVAFFNAAVLDALIFLCTSYIILNDHSTIGSTHAILGIFVIVLPQLIISK